MEDKQQLLTQAADKSRGVIKELKEFISRGNVIDMAVGVIIGGAFTAIVNSLVKDIFTPLLGTVLAGINFNQMAWTVPWGNHPVINFGSFFQAVITFLLTAVCMFIVVKFINSFKRKQEAKPAPPKPSKEEVLLTEIRDLLRQMANDEEEAE